MSDFVNLGTLFNSLLYSILGVIVFWLSFFIVDKLATSVDMWNEIIKERNQPLAIIIAAMCIGIAIIIAAAIH